MSKLVEELRQTYTNITHGDGMPPIQPELLIEAADRIKELEEWPEYMGRPDNEYLVEFMYSRGGYMVHNGQQEYGWLMRYGAERIEELEAWVKEELRYGQNIALYRKGLEMMGMEDE